MLQLIHLWTEKNRVGCKEWESRKIELPWLSATRKDMREGEQRRREDSYKWEKSEICKCHHRCHVSVQKLYLDDTCCSSTCFLLTALVKFRAQNWTSEFFFAFWFSQLQYTIIFKLLIKCIESGYICSTCPADAAGPVRSIRVKFSTHFCPFRYID